MSRQRIILITSKEGLKSDTISQEKKSEKKNEYEAEKADNEKRQLY
jgi:hypothetical protein